MICLNNWINYTCVRYGHEIVRKDLWSFQHGTEVGTMVVPVKVADRIMYGTIGFNLDIDFL